MNQSRLAVVAAASAFAFAVAFAPSAAAADKRFSSVPVNVVNPVLPVEVSNAEPISVVVTNLGDIPGGGGNSDIPGREPYNMWLEYSSTGCSQNCSNFFSLGAVLLFEAPPIPAGKRLIVQSVSGEFPGNTAQNSISFQSTRVLSNQRAIWQFHGPFYATTPAGTLWGMTSSAFFTIESGQSPLIRVRLGGASSFVGGISINGYLINAGP